MTNGQQQIKQAINTACNKLVELTFSDKLHADFDMRFTISTHSIYVYKHVGGNCLPNVVTLTIPKTLDEVEYFNAKVSVFIAQIIRDFSK